MTPGANRSAPAADKLKTVMAAWDKAPAGPKKAAVVTHYQDAEKPKNTAGTMKGLDDGKFRAGLPARNDARNRCRPQDLILMQRRCCL